MPQSGCTLAHCKADRTRYIVIDTLMYLAVMAGFIWFLVVGSENNGYNWQWYQIPKYIFTWGEDGFTPGLLLQGLWVTLKITGISLVLAFFIGLATALCRMSRSFMAHAIARVYMEIIRNSPLLIQLFFIYFVISPIVDLSAFWSAVWTLSLFEGAYASEIFRAGITSIHKGQFEAGKSLGMSAYSLYRHIILPQAIRRILPPLTSQAISLVKDSALVATISIYDLTMQGMTIVSETFLTFEIWFTVAAIYLGVTLILSRIVSVLEVKMNGVYNP